MQVPKGRDQVSGGVSVRNKRNIIKDDDILSKCLVVLNIEIYKILLYKF